MAKINKAPRAFARQCFLWKPQNMVSLLLLLRRICLTHVFIWSVYFQVLRVLAGGSGCPDLTSRDVPFNISIYIAPPTDMLLTMSLLLLSPSQFYYSVIGLCQYITRNNKCAGATTTPLNDGKFSRDSKQRTCRILSAWKRLFAAAHKDLPCHNIM